jgi:polyisoprenoid-binding protein YceI
MRLAVFLLVASSLFPSVSRAQVPVFEIATGESKVQFNVKASVAIVGVFEQWDAKLTFTSTAATSAVLDIQIQAGSVNTGSGMKNGKLRGKDFFDVDENPLITFKSTKIVPLGDDKFEADGDFTIRGVTKPEKLILTVLDDGTGSGTVQGTMAFDRKDYGMNSGIPFIRIANRVEVTINFKANRVSGPRVDLKQ